MIGRRLLIVLISVLVLVGCGSEPTPFPVDIPVTPTDLPPPTDVPPVRYALGMNAQDAIPDTSIFNGEVTLLTEPINPADLGVAYDVAIQFGVVDGWERGQITPQVMLIVNRSLVEAEFIDIIRRGLNPQQVIDSLQIAGSTVVGEVIASPPVNLRVELANMGKPDGLQLAVGHAYIPGIKPMAEQLAAINIETRLISMTNEAIYDALVAGDIHLALVTVVAPEQLQAWYDVVGMENTVLLYDLPISYLLAPGLSVAMLPEGWPIAHW